LPKTPVFGSIRLLEIRLQAANGHKGLGYGFGCGLKPALLNILLFFVLAFVLPTGAIMPRQFLV
jgi:hypothetical protein